MSNFRTLKFIAGVILSASITAVSILAQTPAVSDYRPETRPVAKSTVTIGELARLVFPDIEIDPKRVDPFEVQATKPFRRLFRRLFATSGQTAMTRYAVRPGSFVETVADGGTVFWMTFDIVAPKVCEQCDDESVGTILAAFRIGADRASLIDAADIKTTRETNLDGKLSIEKNHEAVLVFNYINESMSVDSYSIVTIREGRIVVLLDEFFLHKKYCCDQSIEERATIRTLASKNSSRRRVEIVVTTVAESPITEGGDSEVVFRAKYRFVFRWSSSASAYESGVSPERLRKRAFIKHSPGIGPPDVYWKK